MAVQKREAIYSVGGRYNVDNISSSIKEYRAEDKIRDLKKELLQLRKINESHQKEVANLLYDKSRLIGKLRDAGVPLYK